MTESSPTFPVGEFESVESYDPELKSQLIDTLRYAPANLRHMVSGLNDRQLDTKYRNWTVRQIVHHIGDSHLHSYIRFKWTLTEDQPTIKAYEEADWVALEDERNGAIEPSLALLDGLHGKWVQLLESMTREQFARQFTHPQTNEVVSLWQALNYYPWHARHHTGQIAWLRGQQGW